MSHAPHSGRQPHVAQEGAYATAVGFEMPVLHYFPIQGRAEPIRLCLAYLKVEWFEPPIKPLLELYRRQLDGYPFRQLPRYLDGEVDIVTSGAILRHIGRKHHMHGADERQAALVDVLLEGSMDLRARFKELWVERSMKLADVDEYIRTVLAPADNIPQLHDFPGPVMAGLETLVAAGRTAAACPWAAGTESPSIADMALFNLVDLHLAQRELAAVVRDRFPTLATHHAAVASQPGIAEYLESDNRHAALFLL